MKKTLFNNSRYLTPELISNCFIENQITNVDKRQTGNGFSTAFFQTLSKGINILIAPNKKFLEDKELQYKSGKIQTTNRIKFFYAESTETDFNNADVLVFVADSFLSRKESIKNINYKIDKVLIDETHSIEIQSLFRNNLIDFESKVKSICNDINTSIVTVTATPNLFSKIDIVIENRFNNGINMYVSKNRENALERINTDLKANEKVIVFTQSPTAIYKLRNRKNEVKANFIMGKALMISCVELFKVIEDFESNLTIISSKGFEGFDINFENAKVYFLEDRAKDTETFFISNQYQAITRTRKGAKYIEYCRQELTDVRKLNFQRLRLNSKNYKSIKINENNIDFEVESFINDNTISVEQKQKTIYKEFKPFVIFSQNENESFCLKKNEVSINLYKETLLYDKTFPSPEFDKFIKDRFINLTFLSDENNRLKKSVSEKSKVKNLLSNEALIIKYGLFGKDYTLKNINIKNERGKPVYDNRISYLKLLQRYLRRKNYKGSRLLTMRENIALELLSNEKKYFDLISKITKAYDIRSIEKYGFNDSANYRLKFRNNCYNVVCQHIFMFANERIKVPSKWIAHRNYNLVTSIGIQEIKIIGDLFNVRVLEVDAKNCFSRILYALNGLKIPANFYGENKKNKKAINKYLNDFFYKVDSNTPKKIQRNNAIVKFRLFGFDEVVIKYLINNFFESKYRGDLFNKFSFYEKQLITEIKNIITYKGGNSGVIRRHDSILIFDNKDNLTFLNDYEFLNVGGWFEVKETPVIKLEDLYKYDKPFINTSSSFYHAIYG